MSFFKGEIRSSILSMNTALNVILPYDYSEKKGKNPCKVLYLLHGYTESAGSFTRFTNIELLARKYGVAIIMPEVQRSCYVNMEFGMKYYEYISKELPKLCREMFNFSIEPSDTFVAGQSMGGYGAMKWFLNDFDKFGGVATLSGSFDLQKVVDNNVELQSEFVALFGNSLKIGNHNDVYVLANQGAIKDKKIYITCGNEDKFLSDSVKLKEIFEENGTNFASEFTSGCHDWTFWGEALPKMMEFLFA